MLYFPSFAGVRSSIGVLPPANVTILRDALGLAPVFVSFRPSYFKYGSIARIDICDFTLWS
jgi:hypothetical protein